MFQHETRRKSFWDFKLRYALWTLSENWSFYMKLCMILWWNWSIGWNQLKLPHWLESSLKCAAENIELNHHIFKPRWNLKLCEYLPELGTWNPMKLFWNLMFPLKLEWNSWIFLWNLSKLFETLKFILKKNLAKILLKLIFQPNFMFETLCNFMFKIW